MTRPVWDGKLIVHLAAVDFNLLGHREAHSRVVEYRNRATPGSVLWWKHTEYMETLRGRINVCLDTIRYYRHLRDVGALMALPPQYGGRTIMEIIEAEIDKNPDMPATEALAILRNPRPYLTETERGDLDNSQRIMDESESNKIKSAPGSVARRASASARTGITGTATRKDVERSQKVTVVRRKSSGSS